MIKLSCKEKTAYLLTDRLTRKHLTGYDLEEGYLVCGKELCCFADARYYSMVKPELEKLGVKTELYLDLKDVKRYLQEQGVEQLFIDFEKTTLAEYKKYKFFKIKILDGSQQIKLSRSIKTESQISYVEKACQIVQTAYARVMENLRVGMTEIELKDQLESQMLKLGAQSTSFDTIVAFGKNSAIPHHRTGNTVLQEDTVILIDAGCKVNGYCSDLTRTAFFGKPSQKFLESYNAVLSANLTAIEKITDGTLSDEADGFARKLLQEKGYGEYFTHSLGHGVGLEIHEFPTLSPKKSDRLSNGMIFTIEPGVYFDGEFGIRIEDTVMLKDGKVQRLFTDSKELKIIIK